MKAKYNIHCGDCRHVLPGLSDGSVQLTLTSPPYCLGQAYERGTDIDQLNQLIVDTVDLLVAKTRDGGSICWQTGYHVDRDSILPIDYLIYRACTRYSELKLKNRIVWTFGHGPHCRSRFSGRHETILWFAKGNQHFFDLDSVRVPQKYPGKRHYKGPKKGQYSSHRLGKNPGDVWDIPNVKFNHIEKTEHPCQFPFALAERLILSLSSVNDVVLDPFSGSGTTGAAAVHHSRRFVGIDADQRYCKIAEARVSAAATGSLEFRPIDRPIYDPLRAGSVAQQPEIFSCAKG